ncbi:hypothetical protein Tco_0376647, partial [Tanacetum coccineum]
EFLLHRDPSTPKLSVASILEWFTDEPPLDENDDLFDLESKENEWKKILYDAPIDDLMTDDKDSYLLLSFGSEDTIFDPDISVFSCYSLDSVVSHRSGAFMCFNVYLNIFN